MDKFLELRSKYSTFIYDNYEISEDLESLNITYFFEIPGLTSFRPTLKISKKNILNNNIDTSFLNDLVFHIGLVELVSYFKATCSKTVIIRAGYLDENQINWFKKLYYYGLGEFFYTNNINISIEDLMDVKIEAPKKTINNISYKGIGNLIPIGGGKDSVVSMELLHDEYNNNTCFVINPKKANLECINIGGYNDKSIFVYRTIDKSLIELNSKGFLNGHTPFSAIVAFTSYLTAYLSNKKNIILSNEASANEATVLGTKINHQYSKTYEFENDFNEYTNKYFNIDIKYFSLLRPLSEYQIGMLFSRFTQYHSVFKSCNVGSKKEDWLWCCNCPKCLFVFIILSPFLYKEKLVNIFHEDLYEREDLKETFIELLGYSKTKPFECVGTYTEVRYAVSLVIKSMNGKLPYLLDFYKKNYELVLDLNLEKSYNEVNNLDEHFEKILKKELDKNV